MSNSDLFLVEHEIETLRRYLNTVETDDIYEKWTALKVSALLKQAEDLLFKTRMTVEAREVEDDQKDSGLGRITISNNFCSNNSDPLVAFRITDTVC